MSRSTARSWPTMTRRISDWTRSSSCAASAGVGGAAGAGSVVGGVGHRSSGWRPEGRRTGSEGWAAQGRARSAPVTSGRGRGTLTRPGPAPTGGGRRGGEDGMAQHPPPGPDWVMGDDGHWKPPPLVPGRPLGPSRPPPGAGPAVPPAAAPPPGPPRPRGPGRRPPVRLRREAGRRARPPVGATGSGPIRRRGGRGGGGGGRGDGLHRRRGDGRHLPRDLGRPRRARRCRHGWRHGRPTTGPRGPGDTGRRDPTRGHRGRPHGPGRRGGRGPPRRRRLGGRRRDQRPGHPRRGSRSAPTRWRARWGSRSWSWTTRRCPVASTGSSPSPWSATRTRARPRRRSGWCRPRSGATASPSRRGWPSDRARSPTWSWSRVTRRRPASPTGPTWRPRRPSCRRPSSPTWWWVGSRASVVGCGCDLDLEREAARQVAGALAAAQGLPAPAQGGSAAGGCSDRGTLRACACWWSRTRWTWPTPWPGGCAGRATRSTSPTTAREAVDRLRLIAYDLLCLDLNLPDIDGLELCRRLRTDPTLTPADDVPAPRVLMLTARDTIDDRIAGLDEGADDYLVKPFSFAEVSARVRSLLRRDAGRTGSELQVGAARASTRPASRRGGAAAPPRPHGQGVRPPAVLHGPPRPGDEPGAAARARVGRARRPLHQHGPGHRGHPPAEARRSTTRSRSSRPSWAGATGCVDDAQPWAPDVTAPGDRAGGRGVAPGPTSSRMTTRGSRRWPLRLPDWMGSIRFRLTALYSTRPLRPGRPPWWRASTWPSPSASTTSPWPGAPTRRHRAAPPRRAGGRCRRRRPTSRPSRRGSTAGPSSCCAPTASPPWPCSSWPASASGG